mgnify:CR=1 FL=1
MGNLLLLRTAAEGIQKVAAWDLPEPSWGAKAISRGVKGVTEDLPTTLGGAAGSVAGLVGKVGGKVGALARPVTRHLPSGGNLVGRALKRVGSEAVHLARRSPLDAAMGVGGLAFFGPGFTRVPGIAGDEIAASAVRGR